MRTYVDMFAKFRMLKKDADGKFKLLRKNDVSDLSVGGFLFEIGKKVYHLILKLLLFTLKKMFCITNPVTDRLPTHIIWMNVLRMSMQNSVLRQVILPHPCWRPQRESKISMWTFVVIHTEKSVSETINVHSQIFDWKS